MSRLISAAVQLCEPIDLSQNTELRSITLNICGWIYPGVRNFSSYFLSILSATASHVIEEIVICIEHPALETFALHEWEVMASLFDAPRFSGLRNIQFRVFGLTGKDEKALEMLINERLGTCSSRGILSIETYNSRANALAPGLVVQTDV